MGLNSSGQLSIGGSTAGQSINLELGRTATTSSNLNETALRGLAGVASGQISISNFWGKSSDITSQYGLFGGGTTGSSVYTNSTFKYGYSTATSVTSTSLVSTGGGYGLSAAGNSTIGCFFSGRDSSGAISWAISRFTYSNNAVASGVSITTRVEAATGFGNQTYGIVAGGHIFGGSLSQYWNRYTYSSNTCVSYSTLTGGTDFPDGCSNGTYGFLFQPYGTTYRYTFSTNTFSNLGGVQVTNLLGSASTATTTNGYFVGGTSAAYANFSSLAITSISNGTLAQNNYAAAAGNGTIGRYVGGINFPTGAYTLTYSNNTYVASTAPIGSKKYHDATSNPPGSF